MIVIKITKERAFIWVVNMNYLSDNSLGSQLNPIHNNIELTKAMKGRRNCYLYTIGTFQVNEDNLNTLKIRNIKLVGLAFAKLKYKSNKEKLLGKTPINIVFDELESLNIKIGNDINLEHKNRYISGGMH